MSDGALMAMMVRNLSSFISEVINGRIVATDAETMHHIICELERFTNSTNEKNAFLKLNSSGKM